MITGRPDETDPILIDRRDPAAAPRRHLVFTSAGDRSVVASWIHPERTFDLWVVHYGNGDAPLAAIADLHVARRGGKFPNLQWCVQHWPERFAAYEAVWVVDDDIRIQPVEIDRLFALRRAYDLWLLQPAFDPRGRISHPVTLVQPCHLLRLTEMVEMTCPLFRWDHLRSFLQVFDPVVVGWGTDWWYLHHLGPAARGRMAVVDDIVCCNPYEDWKPGSDREILRLQSQAERIATWERIRDLHGIREPAQTPGTIRRVLRFRLGRDLQACWFRIAGWCGRKRRGLRSRWRQVIR